MAEALGIAKAELFGIPAVHGKPGMKGEKKRWENILWFGTMFVTNHVYRRCRWSGDDIRDAASKVARVIDFVKPPEVMNRTRTGTIRGRQQWIDRRSSRQGRMKGTE